MYGVFKIGGKQYRVREGQTVRLEKIDIKEGEIVEFDKVLMLSDGKDIKIGAPWLDGVKIIATVMSHGRSKKIKIIKFNCRKHYRKQQGHRQSFTDIKITCIDT